MRSFDRHAIVLGASMGGLAAARVLADYYDNVTVLDRDALPDVDQHRRGVPHSRHAHGLLAGGLNVLEAWFPGMTGELAGKGALTGDLLADSLWFNHGVYLCQCESGLEGLLLSRPLLEGHTRRRLLQIPNVRIRERTHVQGLVFDNRRNAVTGVTLRQHQTLAADLIVDATGRNSRTPVWLNAAGYVPPEEETVEVAITYTTRLYRRSPAQADGKRVVVVIRSGPPHFRFGVAFAQEDNRWIVTCGGYLGDVASADDAGFRAFARSLPAPELYTIVSSAEPLSAFSRFRFPASLRRHYHRLARFPAGYLVFGDALSSFNPAYGQGMTVALLEADALAACLAPGTDGLARRFFARAAAIIDTPWQIAVGGDLANPKVVAPRSLKGRFLNRYIRKLYRAGANDPFLARRFIAVANLVAPPSSLLAAKAALRTFIGSVRPMRGRARARAAQAAPPSDFSR